MAKEVVEGNAEGSIPKHVVDVFNKKFGEDIDNLAFVEDFLSEYKSKEQTLARALEESAKKTSDDLQQVMGSYEIMLKEIESINIQIENIIGQYVSHGEKSSDMESHLKSLQKSVSDVENEQSYVIWIRHIKSICVEIESHMLKKNISAAVASYNKLHKIWSELQSTTCTNLKKHVNKNCENLFKELKETLFRELNGLLTCMKYPFSTGISSPHYNKKEDTEEQFKRALVCLAKLTPLSETNKNRLIIELFTEPLQKRFRFHFYGERHTNNPEKPEWYFAQVLNWIRDHNSFITGYIQPIIDENQSVLYNLKDEFCQVLVNLVEEKLQDTICIIRNKDVMLAHLIDETVMFENELHSHLLSTDSSIGCLHILLRDDFLDLWLNLEEMFTFESMNTRLEHEEAWVPKYSELTTIDKSLMYYAPKCVEEFITFLSMMNSRHKSLNNINAQQKFFEILLTSMHHFVTKMKDYASIEVRNPESQNYCSILNGAYYMYHVLEEWTEDMYFVQLYAPVNLSDEMDDIFIDGKETDCDRNIFGDIRTTLDRFVTSLIESIVDNLRGGLKGKLGSYKSETWQALPPIKDYVAPTLSPGACDIMLYIKEHLHLLEEKLSPDIFKRVWKQATTMIDHLIFIEVVYESHFNEGGASQLQFDIKENLFVLFGQYTTRADCYFKLLKDSCNLLNLPTGTAYLLKEVLDQNRSKAEYEELVKAALNDIDVKYFNSSQANRLINSRIDYWPKLS